ncbi:MAG: hypothetical protein WC528_00290 [Patescibacteria group bacterium]
MPANRQEKSVRVRIIKKPFSRKDKAAKITGEPARRFEKKPSLPGLGETEYQKKRLIVGVSVSLIMLIVFLVWLSFVGRNLSGVRGENEGLWPKITGYLKESYSGLKNSFEGFPTSVNQNSNSGEDTELEKRIFPATN